MKNSTNYLLAALLVLLASLTAYNMALRTEYRKGTYKDPLRDYSTLNFKNFTEVDAPAAGAVGVRIVAGPFGVRLSPQGAKCVRVSQRGSRLVITAAFPEQRTGLGREAAVVISCPRLLRLRTDAAYEVKGRPEHDKSESFWGTHPVQVQGFTQDSLRVQQDNLTRVELSGNRLGYLRAVAGPSPGSHATLQLNQDNRIAAASFAIEHQSELILNNVAIPRLRYEFADSAKVTLTGAALGSLRK